MTRPATKRNAPGAGFLVGLRPWQLLAGAIALCVAYCVAFGLLGILGIQTGLLLAVACILGALILGAAAAKQDTGMLWMAVFVHLAAVGAAASSLIG